MGHANHGCRKLRVSASCTASCDQSKLIVKMIKISLMRLPTRWLCVSNFCEFRTSSAHCMTVMQCALCVPVDMNSKNFGRQK